MISFEDHMCRQRCKSIADRASRARRAEERRKAALRARAAEALAASELLLAMTACAVLPSAVAVSPAAGKLLRPAPESLAEELMEQAPEQALEEAPEEAENQRIEAALLARARVIKDCTVTWYTADTCGKRPGSPGYGITASGLPAVEHLTCAVDPAVIPLYSDVFVEYAGGEIEQLWATDTGVRGEWIDIYTPDRETAIQNGLRSLTVWFVPPEGEAP